jgi:hypothetical protein
MNRFCLYPLDARKLGFLGSRGKILSLGIHFQVLQNVIDRLEKALSAFFRRCKAEKNLVFQISVGCIGILAFAIPKVVFPH